MGSKLFVGSLSWNTTDDSLKAAFEAHGPVREARVIMDRDTGRSRGFGFVTFEEEAHAKAAVDKMNGASLDGRNIRVNEAEERSGGGRGRPGGGRGGYNNRGGGRRGPPEVHTRGRAPGPRRDGPGDGPRRDGGPRGDRGSRPPRRDGDRGGPPRGGNFRPGGSGGRFQGGGGGRGGFSPPAEEPGGWEEDRTRRAEPRAKKRKAKGPRNDNEDFRPRSENRRSKRESGRSWRDYTSDEDYDEFE